MWDLRAFIAHRTDLAREVYVVAEVIATRPDANLIEPVAAAFKERFAGNGAGSIDIAVVKRGNQRRDDLDSDGSLDPCQLPYDDQAALSERWCPPLVQVRWPAPSNRSAGLWGERCPAHFPSCVSSPGGTHCQESDRSRSRLPEQDEHFPATETVFPNEGQGGSGESGWLSRDFNDGEWWTLVDVCLEPGHGLFTGRLIPIGWQAVNFSELTFTLRAAWRSLHTYNDCEWCQP